MRTLFIITARLKSDPEDLREYFFDKKKNAQMFIHLAQEDGFEITDMYETLLFTPRESLHELQCFEALAAYSKKKLKARH